MFAGLLALTGGYILIWGSFSFVQKHFLGQFSLLFLEHIVINPIVVNKNRLKVFFKLSNMNLHLSLTLGYLNPALIELATRLIILVKFIGD